MDYYQIYLGLLAIALLVIYSLKKRRDDDLIQNEAFAKIIKAVLSQKEPITAKLLDFHYFVKNNDKYIYDSDVLVILARPTKEDSEVYEVTTTVNQVTITVTTAKELNELMGLQSMMESANNA